MCFPFIKIAKLFENVTAPKIKEFDKLFPTLRRQITKFSLNPYDESEK